MYRGQSIRLQDLGDGLVELVFDREGEAINKLDNRTVEELAAACAELRAQPGLRGVLVSSAKDVFIVGADITEFGAAFQRTEAEIVANNLRLNAAFTAFEDLPVLSVLAINGFALGGGLEMSLAATYRLMSSNAQVGLPEVKLGLIPGFGGTVRLPRVAGPAVALDWITSGKPQKAEAALAAGVVDAVVEPEVLRATALDWLRRAAAGELDAAQRAAAKRATLPQSAEELDTLFAAARAQAKKTSPKHQPAAAMVVDLLARSAGMARDAALQTEAETFAQIAKTQAAAALIQSFLNDQLLKKLFKQHAKQARPVKQGAVLGAGIMGGGIAYTSAFRGTPVLLKDIAQAQIDLGLNEARKLLNKQVKAGRLAPEKADRIHASIEPRLDYSGFERADVVIEAVVENLGLKKRVLAELEDVVRPDTVIASNTSSLRIDDMAVALKRPQNFVGMHFFNPVPVMPLVEIIQGVQTSAEAVSTAVGYAVAMGKTPIVVKDCPGFLVNRILAAYIRGFIQLVADGADFERCDQVMEAFGWPMGPAYLEDVVGMDTGAHVCDVIAAGYPERMPLIANDALKLMAGQKRFGQKNGIGFYQYETDPNGKPKRSVAADSRELLQQVQPNGTREFSEQDIIDRMMVPLIIEAAHALEEGVVASPAELDQALLLGIGFPAYLGGACKYADWLGLATVVAKADALADLGPGYVPTARMRAMAASGQTYY